MSVSHRIRVTSRDHSWVPEFGNRRRVGPLNLPNHKSSSRVPVERLFWVLHHIFLECRRVLLQKWFILVLLFLFLLFRCVIVYFTLSLFTRSNFNCIRNKHRVLGILECKLFTSYLNDIFPSISLHVFIISIMYDIIS